MKLQRNILCFFSCFLFGVAQAKNVDFKLEAVPLPKAVGMIYDEVLEKPYMLDPKLAADTRLISFHTKEDQDFNQFIRCRVTVVRLNTATIFFSKRKMA
mgnify:CR=1 FL=1